VARVTNSVQIDLGDSTFDAIHIFDSGAGFKIGPPNGAFFVRPNKQQPLPRPVPCSNDLFVKKFRNLIPDLVCGHWLLVLAFILKALNRDQGSFVILIIAGPQGSGKSVLTSRIKAIVDPAYPASTPQPRIIDQIVVAARNSYLLIFDNMSGLSHEMADIFCQVSTGGGISNRSLYTNHDESFYDIHRPVISNGINDPSIQPDFLDRCVIVELAPPSDDLRVAKTELDKQFYSDLPQLLGGLYGLLSECLQVLPSIQTHNLPRMTDYARMGIALEKVLKLKKGEFLRIYERSRNAQNENSFWNSDLCHAIYDKLQRTPSHSIEGSAHDLMKMIFGRGSLHMTAIKTARGFAEALRLAEPTLKVKGIVVDRPPRSAEKRKIVIRSEVPMSLPQLNMAEERERAKQNSRLKGVSGEYDLL
jgi:hypothetical protein